LYRVDFEPDIEIAGLRKAFVGNQRELFGGYLYDGQNMLYLTHRLPEETMEFTMTSREGQDYKLKIKNTGAKIEMTDSMATQILNLILRRTMEGLNLQLVGRNLYDPANRVRRN
jgi:aubergine